MNSHYNKSQSAIRSYDNISLIKFLLSLIIVIFHLRPFQDVYPNLDYFINSGLGRICVPFFFYTSGFIIAQKEEINSNYLRTYNKRNIRIYLIWSCIYLPLLIVFCYDNFHLVAPTLKTIIVVYDPPLIIYPLLSIILMLILLLYSGVYYHLWFYPALLISINIVSKWNRTRSVKRLLLISFCLLLFGATETYWGFLPSQFKTIFKIYYDVFFTTRNFLFFGLFYVCFGYYSYSRQTFINMDINPIYALVFSVLLFLTDLILIKNTDRLNSNILLSVIPLTYFLFHVAIKAKPFRSHKNKKSLDFLSKYIYLTHPIAIFFIKKIYLSTWYSIIATFFICYLLNKIIVLFKYFYATKKDSKTLVKG